MSRTDTALRIAVPMRNGQFCEHFGRCDAMAVYALAEDGKSSHLPSAFPRPLSPGRCESLPEWLAGLDIDVILVGGIGQTAQQALAQRGITVKTGYHQGDADELIQEYLHAPQSGGDNLCHGSDRDHRHCRKG